MNRDFYIERRKNPIDLDDNIGVGIKFPLSLSGRTFEQSYTIEDQASSNLKNLLLTMKGERYMQPDFGCDLMKYIFEPMTDNLTSRIRSQIIADITYWLPYIISNVDVQFFKDAKNNIEAHSLFINIDYRVTEFGANKTITVFVDQQSGITVEDV